METIEDIIKDLLVDAKTIAGDKVQVDKLLSDLKNDPKTKQLTDNVTDLTTLIELVKDYFDNAYTDIPINSVITIVATLLYLLSKKDFIPDCIPNTGLHDDKMIIESCLKSINKELVEYKKYKGISN